MDPVLMMASQSSCHHSSLLPCFPHHCQLCNMCKPTFSFQVRTQHDLCDWVWSVWEPWLPPWCEHDCDAYYNDNGHVGGAATVIWHFMYPFNMVVMGLWLAFSSSFTLVPGYHTTQTFTHFGFVWSKCHANYFCTVGSHVQSVCQLYHHHPCNPSNAISCTLQLLPHQRPWQWPWCPDQTITLIFVPTHVPITATIIMIIAEQCFHWQISNQRPICCFGSYQWHATATAITTTAVSNHWSPINQH